MLKNDVAPFVKWAGGKRQLLPYIKNKMPQNYKNYFEPFIGGGAVLFSIMPENAIINDINRALINTYKYVRDMPQELIEKIIILDKYNDIQGKDFFYKQRELFNNKLIKEEYDLELASLFIYLNKHCFNGLYRVNSKGLFNVPYNNSKAQSFDDKNILAVSKYLKNVTILEGDFEIACKEAKKGDFLFLDSPYAPLKGTSFEAYTKEGFDLESHKRLANLFKKLTQKGCFCMLTNHYTVLIEELYSEYNQEIVKVRRSINANASDRKGIEVIITNY